MFTQCQTSDVAENLGRFLVRSVQSRGRAVYSVYVGVHVALTMFAAVAHNLIIRPKRCFVSGESWKYSMGQKNGVDAFGYNSAESEPILMKSGTM